MPVSAAFRTFALEQLSRVAPVTHRAMFGGVGIYSEGLFFALMDDDVLYLKVDDVTRGDFEAAGCGPFRPAGPAGEAMQYYELPGDLLEDADRLRPWVAGALDVARRSRRRSR
jgi:DNA transformation protein and related proteins